MFCSKCGQQIPDNSRFCENCGSRVEIKNTPQPPRQEPQWSAPQSYVEEETFTESPKQSKELGFVPMVLIFAVIAVGAWFLKGFLDDGEPVVYVPNQIQQSAQTDSRDPAQPSQQQSVQADTPPVQTDAPPVQGDPGEGEYDVSGIEDTGEIGEDDTGNITERLSTYERKRKLRRRKIPGCT